MVTPGPGAQGFTSGAAPQYALYEVGGDGGVYTFAPPFIAASIEIDNQSDRRCTVLDDTGRRYVADPGTIRAMPVRQSRSWSAQMQSRIGSSQGYCNLVFRNFIYSAIFGQPNATPLNQRLLVPANTSQTIRTIRPTSQVRLQVNGVTVRGALTLHALTYTYAGQTVLTNDIPLMQNIWVTAFAGMNFTLGLPVIIPVELPAETDIILDFVSSFGGALVAEVGY